MTTHELKTWPDPFAAILDGRKRYEIRKADRDFAEGDTLRLREWNEQSRAIPYGYTGREITVRVTYMSPPGAWGLPADLCVMGVAPLAASPSASSEARECGEARVNADRLAPAPAAPEAEDGGECACVQPNPACPDCNGSPEDGVCSCVAPDPACWVCNGTGRAPSVPTEGDDEGTRRD